ncbi:uncharacterized protein [Rutidosis leptorrhynchoides]|uniref:uncharacterized protein n=1 Tax=Rutidosis leptorrhynchoides TaxID=125765 RepID=UPI003A9930EE
MLYEIPLGVLQYTWRNKAGNKLSKLDIYFVSNNILNVVDELKGTVLARGHSDHSPIMLFKDKVNFGPSYFKIFESWFLRPDFDSFVRSNWDNISRTDNRDCVAKLRNLKARLKTWIHSSRSSEATRLSDVIKNINEIDTVIDAGQTDDNLINNRDVLSAERDDLIKLTSFDAIQKSRIKWDVEGDENSKFFPLAQPVLITDFHPISLVGFFYKIVTKILTNRLLHVIDKLVSPVQSAFISGHQILDGPLMLSEIVDWYKKTNRRMLLFKVDFEKANDSVNWDYLIFMLKSLGFGNTWCDWIMGCLKSAKTSVLVNGSPTSEFEIKRGLRQGDPLSPFLFIIFMEGLHLASHRATQCNLIRGINVGKDNIHLSHFLYADDFIIFSDWDIHELNRILIILEIFYLVSGLRINVSKSHVFVIGVDEDEVNSIAFACGTRAVLKNLESIRARFFLGGSESTKKMAWVKWGKVLAPLDHGGLSIGSLKAFNVALILKWKWRYLTKNDELWVTIIKSIHGSNFDQVATSCSSIWSNIVSSCAKHCSNDNLPTDLFRLQVGNGNSISFWHDKWCGNETLAIRYNRLYHLDVNKNDTVADKLRNDEWRWTWSREVIGSRNDQLVTNLLNDIRDVHLSNRADQWTSPLASDGMFTVNKSRDYMDRKILLSTTTKTCWFKFVPRKVNVFLWRFRLDSLPVRWLISAKGIDIHSIVCPVCNNGVETRDHLFFGCTLALDLWRRLRMWLNCAMPIFSSWDTFIVWIEGVHLSSIQKKRVTASVVTLLWAMWRYRNGVVFNDVFCNRNSLFDLIRLLSFRWIKNRGHLVSNWNSWLAIPL